MESRWARRAFTATTACSCGCRSATGRTQTGVAGSTSRCGRSRPPGHPVITIDVPYAYGLGGEFLRWEIATAVTGTLLGIDPFDEPNVQEAKDATAAILEQGSLDPDTGGDVLTPDAPAVREHLRAARPGDYAAFLAYIQRTAEHDELLARLRVSDALRDARGDDAGVRAAIPALDGAAAQGRAGQAASFC